MNNFDKWKASMTVELAGKINDSIEECAYDDDEYEKIPTNKEEIQVWVKADNFDDIQHLFSISECEFCPADGGRGCPDIDDCVGAFEGWALEEAYHI